ncbi:MAG: ATP-NAD kinase family protein [Tissierellia bacterium]|nr:ATP-NAD kinase family protein [Tissierellia bacterium]
MFRIGLIINPAAGIGGKLGWKGSDHPEFYPIKAQEAILQKEPQRKTEETFQIVKEGLEGEDFLVLTGSGTMGEDLCQKLDIAYQIVYVAPMCTQASDTALTAKRLVEEEVDLIVFAGGDGTARDLLDEVTDQVVVLGIPAGVKMHSSVFAVNPSNAARMILDFVHGALRDRLAEVMDINEDLLKDDVLEARLYGYLRVPDDITCVQRTKVGRQGGEQEKAKQIAQYIADNLIDDAIYIIAPGSTTGEIMKILGLDYTLLGVDVVQCGELLAKDVNESDLLRIVESVQAIYVIITIIGGQGFLFGRGNQQISAKVLGKISKENIKIICTPQKIVDLRGRPIRVDTGSKKVDEMLRGYHRIIVGYDEDYVYQVK